MEQINRVELRGIVGNTHYYDAADGGQAFARISLVTKHAYHKPSTGEDVVESTWHNVIANQNRNFPPLDKICKGDTLHIVGRLRNNKFVGQDGQDRYSNDVVALTLEKEAESATIQF